MSRRFVQVMMVAAVILVACCIAVVSEQKPVVIISGHTHWSPAMSSDGKGNIVGFGPDATEMVLKEIGYNARSLDVGPWNVVQEKARTGEIDAIVALYKTKEREEYLDYSIPYMTDPIVLFFASGKNFTYNSKEDLIGKRGIATVGDSYGQEIDDFIVEANLNMSRVATPQEAFHLLGEGKADYFIYSAYSGRSIIKESNLSGFEESGVVSEELFYIGISKKSPLAKEMPRINASLEKMIKEGKIPH